MHTDSEIQAMTPDEIRLLIADLKGYPASWWSIHPWKDAQNAAMFEVRPFAHGLEAMLPDAKGDSPCLEMQVNGEWVPIPCWPTDIAHAWELMEEMGRNCRTRISHYQKDTRYYCTVWDDGHHFMAYSENPSFAICLCWIPWKEAGLGG